MHRRRFVQACTAGALAVRGAGTFAQGSRPLRRQLPLLEAPSAPTPDTLPVVDFHTHIQRTVTAEDLVRRMDQTGVSRMVLMPLYYGDGGGAINDGEGSDEQALDYARRYPGRFVPLCGMQRGELNWRPAWYGSRDALKLVDETDAKLASGEFFGIGELMMRFYPYRNKFGIVATTDMDYPVFSPTMRRFAELSAKYKAPMVLHAEAEPAVADNMRKLLESHPEAIVVWAHNCGRSSATAISELMAQHKNLYADLGGMVYSGPSTEHYGVYFPRKTEWMHLVVDSDGTILPEMKSLFERFPDRFVIGTDIAHARVYVRYARHIPRWRSFFGQVNMETAQAIAWKNADRIVRG